MASQDSVIVNAVSNLLVAQASSVAMLAFVVYDWLISLDEEIRCFWTFRKGGIQSVAGLLYGLSRYVIIVSVILEVQTMAPLSEMACKANAYAQFVLNIPILFIPAFFTAIRVYALSQNKSLALSTFILNFGLFFAITLTNLSNTPGVLPPPFNWSIYFLSITGVSILNLIIYETASTSAGTTSGWASAITTALSNVLTCRFLLDLRQVDRTANAPTSMGAVSSLNFDAVGAGGSQAVSRRSLPAFVASMGSEVQTGLDFVDAIARDTNEVNEEVLREVEALP